MIWFGLTWDMEDYEQTIKRLDRQGQTRSVTIYRIITEGTLEVSLMVPQLAARKKGQERLFDALKDYWEANKAEACT